MPTYSRRYLRQALGRSHARDTYVGSTTATYPQSNYSINIVDGVLADLALSGQNRYVGAWLWVSGSELRVASFNVGSGALLSQAATYLTLVAAGAEYEIHETLRATEKNRALDDAIQQLRDRREVTIDTVTDAHVYALPNGVNDVLDVYYFASPTATLDRIRRRLNRFDLVETATGTEIRIDPALAASQQVVLDAIATLTLGAADTATVNVPDERLVLFGAEAKCWDLMVRKAPRGTADEYRTLRNEAARQYSLLAARFKVPVDRPPRLDNPTGQVF